MSKDSLVGSSTKIAELTNYVSEGNGLVDEMNSHLNDFVGLYSSGYS